MSTPFLSEKDFSTVEKLYNAAIAILSVTRSKNPSIFHHIYNTPPPAATTTAVTTSTTANDTLKPVEAKKEKSKKMSFLGLSGDRKSTSTAAAAAATMIPVVDAASSFALSDINAFPPSEVLRTKLEKRSAAAPTAGDTATTAGTAAANDNNEKRLWTEFALLFWRTAYTQHTHLLYYVSNAPILFCTEIAYSLLFYLKTSLAQNAQLYAGDKIKKMELIEKLGTDRLFYLLRSFCSVKRLRLMMQPGAHAASSCSLVGTPKVTTSSANWFPPANNNNNNNNINTNSASQNSSPVHPGDVLFDSICSYIIEEKHFQWMSQVYVQFCDYAALCDANGFFPPGGKPMTAEGCSSCGGSKEESPGTASGSGAPGMCTSSCCSCISSAVVVATSDVLRAMHHCCAAHDGCAHEVMYSEPSPCVTYMFYGIKLRIMKRSLLRPREADPNAPSSRVVPGEKAGNSGYADDLDTSTLSSPGRHDGSSLLTTPLKEDQERLSGARGANVAADEAAQVIQAMERALGGLARPRNSASSWTSCYFAKLERYRNAGVKPVSSKRRGGGNSSSDHHALEKGNNVNMNSSLLFEDVDDALDSPPQSSTGSFSSYPNPSHKSGNSSFAHEMRGNKPSKENDSPAALMAQVLHQFIRLGRCNAFDELMHLAFDVVIEAVKRSHEYQHWAVMSTIISFITLSVKGLQEEQSRWELDQATVGPATRMGPKELVSQTMTKVMLYENVVVSLRTVVAMLETIQVEKKKKDELRPSCLACDGVEHATTSSAAEWGVTAKEAQAVQDRREWLLQEIIKADLSVSIQEAAEAAPEIVACDHALFQFCRDLCSLDELNGRKPTNTTAAAASTTIMSAINSSLGGSIHGATKSEPRNKWGAKLPPGVGGIATNVNTSFSIVHASTNVTQGPVSAPHYNNTFAYDAGAHSATKKGGLPRVPSLSGTVSSYGGYGNNKTFGGNISFASGMDHGAGGSEAGSAVKEKNVSFAVGDKKPAKKKEQQSFAKSFFKSMFSGGAEHHHHGPKKEKTEKAAAGSGVTAASVLTRANSGHFDGSDDSKPSSSATSATTSTNPSFDPQNVRHNKTASNSNFIDDESLVDPMERCVWEEVPSYVALAGQIVGVLNAIFLNTKVGVDVSLAAGLLLPHVVLQSGRKFELYHGHETILNTLRVFQESLRRHTRVVPDEPFSSLPTTDAPLPGVTNSGTAAASASASGNAAGFSSPLSSLFEVRNMLSASEFTSFVEKTVRTLEQAYLVLEIAPLTSEAVIMTELPLYFISAAASSEKEKKDSSVTSVEGLEIKEGPGGVASTAEAKKDKHRSSLLSLQSSFSILERFFVRVVALWSHALAKSECDEDMDARAMQVLSALMERALGRGSLPREAALTLPGVGQGLFTTGKGNASFAYGDAAGPSSPMATRGGRAATGFSVRRSNSQQYLDTLVLTNSFTRGGEGIFNNSSLFGDTILFTAGIKGVAIGGGNECVHTVETLINIFTLLIHRSPTLLGAKTLAILFSFFTSEDSGLAQVGRECMLSSLDFEEVYPLYAQTISNVADPSLAIDMVDLFTSYLFTEEMSAETKFERRVWILEQGCFQATLTLLCDVLAKPDAAPNFLRVVSHLFRFFCAFEPPQGCTPSLSDTPFVDVVSEQLRHLSGIEFVIIVTQTALDAATVNYAAKTGNCYSMTMVGAFNYYAAKCSASKPIFLDLLPPLALYLRSHQRDMFHDLLEVLLKILQSTTNVRSDRLVDFVMEHNLTRLLPFLELPARIINELPFTGDAQALRTFWAPILKSAHSRSEIRFHTTGGVRVTVGSWPAKGFSISSYFFFNSICTTMPLFTFCGADTTAGKEDNAIMICVFGGDSVQLSYNGHSTTLNEKHALQNFEINKWLHVCAVVSVAHTVTVYLNGFNVGTAVMPFFTTGSEVCVKIGFVDYSIEEALYSIGEISLWDEELTRPQVEADLAVTRMLYLPAKVLLRELARELASADVISPIDDRIARYVPYESDHMLLVNLLDGDGPYPLVAKVVGNHASLPKFWINYYVLWATHGGVYKMLEWLDAASSTEDVEEVLYLLAECTRRTSVMTTVDARMYLLLNHLLKQKAKLLSITACDHVLHLGTATFRVNEVEHPVILNRLLFKYVLSDSELYVGMPIASALHILQRVGVLFTPSLCRNAKYNAKYVTAGCFVDRLLHSLVNVAVRTCLRLRSAVVDCAKNVMVANDMEETLVHAFISLVAQLTPGMMTCESKRSPHVKVALPNIAHLYNPLPLRTSDNLTVELLRCLVACEGSTLFMNSISHVITVSWYCTVVSYFANPSSVVYATKLFFSAVSLSPSLREQVAENQATIIEALLPHAIYEDLVLLLLAITIGVHKHMNLLSDKYSLQQQLDGVLTSHPEPFHVVAPIFVRVFALHLNSIISNPFYNQISTTSVLLGQQRISYRVRRFFSLAVVCSRIMLWIKAKRYRNTARHYVMELRRQTQNSLIVGQKGANALVPVALQTKMGKESGGPLTADSHSPSPDLLPNDSLNIVQGTSFVSPTILTNTNISFSNPYCASFALSPRPEGPHITHRKHKRAFAVLRVCVLLFTAVQVRRFRWVRQLPPTSEEADAAEEDSVCQKHQGTLFGLRVLQRYASMPSFYYLFVSSPLQTTAFSAFVNYISRDRLEKRIESWDGLIRLVDPRPEVRHLANRVSPEDLKHMHLTNAFQMEALAMAPDAGVGHGAKTMEEVKAENAQQQDRRMLSPQPPRDDLESAADDRASDDQRPLPLTQRALQSKTSSVIEEQSNTLSSYYASVLPDPEGTKSVTKPQSKVSTTESVKSPIVSATSRETSNMSFDAAPPSTYFTKLPPHRMGAAVTFAEDTETVSTRARSRTTSMVASSGEDDSDLDDDDVSSQASAATSQGADLEPDSNDSASRKSSPALVPLSAPQTAEVAAGVADLLLASNDADMTSVDIFERMVAVVGEVVRREAVGVLGALVKSSLRTPAHQGWIGGPSYGSCGGLLFQILLIVSAKSVTDESVPTLISFFLHHVVHNIREEQSQTLDNNSMAHEPASMMHFGDSHAAHSVDNSSLHTQDTDTSSADESFQGTTPCSEIFLFNVSHFSEFLVDMLSINVVDLPAVSNYFMSLLVLSQSWPSRYIHQLSTQVVRSCISVLNKPTVQEASVSLIETIYALITLVLRRGFKMKGSIECLFRVLYKVYVSLPPVWMSEDDARYRKMLVVLTLKHVMKTYDKTKELQKALTVRSLTQRLSLYDALRKVFSNGSDLEVCKQFGGDASQNRSSLDTLVANRMKAKADLALKTSIKLRGEYIKRIKLFNQQFVAVTELKDGFHPMQLRHAFRSQYTSYIARMPALEESQLTLLLGNNAIVSLSRLQKAEHEKENISYHHVDVNRTYVKLADRYFGAHGREKEESGNASPRPPAAAVPAGANGEGEEEAPKEEDTGASHPHQRNTVARCEENMNHVAVLCPALCTRCRPYVGEGLPPFIDPNIKISLRPSAITLLRFILNPGQILRFISNGFRIYGIQATPCLILLTNTTLLLISFSRVTQDGDIILCQYTEDEDEGANVSFASSLSDGGDSSCSTGPAGSSGVVSSNFSSSPRKQNKVNPFSFAAVTKQLQRFLTDDKTRKMRQLLRDGSRVAQSVRQATSSTYRQTYWSYITCSIREVRSLHYMHQDTAVALELLHDEGPLLSIVDASQSMNSAARAEFLRVLKDVVNPCHCRFVDDTTRGMSLRSMLVRWAAGSVSNYDYLMFLNQMAGRTVRDFNQYPVFPWVLADYQSTTLDLERAETFRNFAYPMGAQTEVRRQVITQLYQNTKEVVDIDTGKSYPFHHGTHYSTSGGVLYFMIRVEPYTTFAKLFQGGDFDIATRLFDSVSASFNSCVLGPADCKELLPDFYQNCQFLLNADRLQFGVKSDGGVVDNVQLPPWAKNSVQVFTAVMRFALESEHVRNHIHSWIDLIFGVRRRGQLAVEQFNCFQRMTYGEEVQQALKEAETPRDCDVIIAEVDNFGQTPVQLFHERHPSRLELEPVKKPSPSGTGKSSLSSTGQAPFMTSVHIGNASGNTYTQTFEKHAPNTMRMLLHALDVPQTCFQLRELGPQKLHTPPPLLRYRFLARDKAVTGFSTLPSGKVAACYSHMIPVEDEDYYLCWHWREGRMMRFNSISGEFRSAFSFEIPDVSCQRVSAIAVSPSETLLLVAVANGTIYCLYPDAVRRGIFVGTILVCHKHPVTGIAVDAASGLVVTYTDSIDDPARVWRLGRNQCCLLHTLRVPPPPPGTNTGLRGSFSNLDGTLHAVPSDALAATTTSSLALSRSGKSTTGELTTTDNRDYQVVIGACFDQLERHVVLATRRSLRLYDGNGELLGHGALPAPKVREGALMLEDSDGQIGVAVDKVVPYMAHQSCVEVYRTKEWASGIRLYLTGHEDGSLALWRATRLPPGSVAPGRVVMVEFHGVLLEGAKEHALGAVTAIRQKEVDVPFFYIGFADGNSRCLEFEVPIVAPQDEKSKSETKKK